MSGKGRSTNSNPSGPQNDRLSSLLAMNEKESGGLHQQHVNVSGSSGGSGSTSPSRQHLRGGSSGSRSTQNQKPSQSQKINTFNSITGDLRPSTENNIYLDEIERLKRDNSFLDDQLQRALKELKHFQLQHPSEYSSIRSTVSKEMEMGINDNLPWSQNVDIMSPMFRAYDEKIARLEEEKESQSIELRSYCDRVETLVQENDELRHQQLDNLENSVNDITLDETSRSRGQGISKGSGGNTTRIGGSSEGGVGEVSRTTHVYGEENAMDEMLTVLREENAVLTEQVHVSTKELDAANKDLNERDKQIEVLLSSLREAGMSIKKYEEENVQLSQEKEGAETQLLKRINELSAITVVAQERKQALDIAGEQIESLVSKLEELNSSTNGEKDRYETEIDLVTSKYQALAKRLRELQGMLASKQQENDLQEDRIRKLARELESTRLDAEGMMKVMSGLQKQIEEYTAREQDVENLSLDAKKQIQEAMIEVSKYKATEEQSRKELERLMELRREEACKKIEEFEQEKNAIKQKYRLLLDTKEREIVEITGEIKIHKMKTDQLMKEKNSLDSLYQDLNKNFMTLSNVTEDKLNDCKQKILNVEHEKNSALTRAETLNRELNRLRGDINMKNEKYEMNKKELEMRITSREKERDALRQSVRLIEIENDTKSREMIGLTKRLEEKIKEYDDKLSKIQSKHSDEKEKLVNSILRLESQVRDHEPTLHMIQERHKMAMEKIRNDRQNTIDALEAQLRDGRDICTRLTARTNELSIRLSTLTAERSDMLLDLENQQEQIEKLEDNLTDGDRKNAELATQISLSLSKQEDALKENSKLKIQLNRLRNELDTSKSAIAGNLSNEKRFSTYSSNQSWTATNN